MAPQQVDALRPVLVVCPALKASTGMSDCGQAAKFMWRAKLGQQVDCGTCLSAMPH